LACEAFLGSLWAQSSLHCWWENLHNWVIALNAPPATRGSFVVAASMSACTALSN